MSVEKIIGLLKNPMETIIRAMGNAGTNNNKKLSARRIAHLRGSTGKENSYLKSALRALRTEPFRLLDPPSGHGYFLNSRGQAVYERLKKAQLKK